MIFLDYLKEVEEFEILNHETAFVAYRVVGEECYIGHMFVRPEYRGSKVAIQLVEKMRGICEKKGATFFSAMVDTSYPGATFRLQSFIHFGFKTIGVEASLPHRVILKKDF